MYNDTCIAEEEHLQEHIYKIIQLKGKIVAKYKL